MGKRFLAALVCIAAILAMIPSFAVANETAEKTYLALGDSISTGYGLDGEGAVSFVDIFAGENGLTADPTYARDGMTSSELCALIADEDAAARVAAADVITVTVGSNDMLGALYGYVASAWSAANPDAPLTGDEIQQILAGDRDLQTKLALIDFASGQLATFAASDEASSALAELTANLTAVVSGIRTLNPDVRLLVANLYNPYGYLAQSMAGSAWAETGLAISAGFDAATSAVNAVIEAGAATGTYAVADLHTAIADASENPCNAGIEIVSYDPSAIDIDLDFHPNAYGHGLIADEFTRALHPSYAYADVEPGAWYVDAIDWAIAAGVLGGYGDAGVMGPTDPLTRAQFAEMLWRIAQKPEADSSVLEGFADVDLDAWYVDSLSWAVSMGLLGGYTDGSGLMAPDAALTREQLAVVLERLAASSGQDTSARADLSAFPDADTVSTWAVDAVSWAVATGVVQGVETPDGTRVLAPLNTTQRAEAATVLMRIMTVTDVE